MGGILPFLCKGCRYTNHKDKKVNQIPAYFERNHICLNDIIMDSFLTSTLLRLESFVGNVWKTLYFTRYQVSNRDIRAFVRVNNRWCIVQRHSRGRLITADLGVGLCFRSCIPSLRWSDPPLGRGALNKGNMRNTLQCRGPFVVLYNPSRLQEHPEYEAEHHVSFHVTDQLPT